MCDMLSLVNAMQRISLPISPPAFFINDDERGLHHRAGGGPDAPGGSQRGRVDPPGAGLPARARDQGRRSHTVGLAAGKADPQGRTGPGGQGVEGLDDGSGLLNLLIVIDKPARLLR
jgi:hypothetical protein